MDFSIAPDGRRLLVRLSGAPSEAEVRRMLAEVLAAARATDAQGALVEVRVAFGLDSVSVLALVNDLPALGFPPAFKFAVLLLDDAARDSAQFAETAAANRGRAVRAFSDRAAALAWLG